MTRLCNILNLFDRLISGEMEVNLFRFFIACYIIFGILPTYYFIMKYFFGISEYWDLIDRTSVDYPIYCLLIPIYLFLVSVVLLFPPRDYLKAAIWLLLIIPGIIAGFLSLVSLLFWALVFYVSI